MDGESANEFRASLRSLNALVRGFTGLPAYNVRSVLEFGAGGDGATNDYQAFQNALASFGPSGGQLLIPPGTYLIDLRIEDPTGSGRIVNRLPLTIPRFVHVKGAGIGHTVLEFRFASPPPPPDEPLPPTQGIRFAAGDNYGQVADLLLRGDAVSPTGIGLSFAGSQFNVATHLQIWYFAIGADMSDGTSVYSAHNELSTFLVSRCTLGVRCYREGNGNWIERGRVFWAFGPPPLEEPDGDGTGVGIDVDAAQALSIRSVAIESANICFRFRATGATARTTCEMSGCYFEPTPSSPPPPEEGEEPLPPPPLGSYRIFDVSYPSVNLDPGGVTYLRLGANRYVGTLGRLDVPPEALADFGAVSESPFGAHTHFAAHAHRQFSENHDLRMYDSSFIPGAWQVLNGADVVEEGADVFAGGRTLRITRTSDINTGVIRKRIVVPEDVEWATVGFRYKNISCHNINYFASSASFSVNGGDLVAAGSEPPGEGFREKWLKLRKDRSTDEIVATIEINHPLNPMVPQIGAEILVEAIWCVPGRVRTSDFRYEQGMQYLEQPQQILERTGIIANENWSVDWTTLTGLAAAPRGTVGAIVAMHLTATRNDNGHVVPRPVSVTVSGTAGATVYAERDGRVSTRQVAVRRSLSIEPTTIRGTFVTELDASFPTDYQIYVVGWILG